VKGGDLDVFQDTVPVFLIPSSGKSIESNLFGPSHEVNLGVEIELSRLGFVLSPDDGSRASFRNVVCFLTNRRRKMSKNTYQFKPCLCSIKYKEFLDILSDC
jgi:hypothetical protein